MNRIVILPYITSIFLHGIFGFFIVLSGSHQQKLNVKRGSPFEITLVENQQKKKLHHKIKEKLPAKQTPKKKNTFSETQGVARDSSPFGDIQPIYPKLSRHLNEEGTVIIEIVISENGQIQGKQIFKSSGHKRLDQAALEALNKTEHPNFKHKSPLSSNIKLTFNFSLNRKDQK